MASNFNIGDTGARNNSSVDIGGYSLLPDLMWVVSPEMLNSQFGQVIFTNVREFYATNEDLHCIYSIIPGIEMRHDDRVAIFSVGWTHIDQVITWVPAAKHPWPNGELSIVFPADNLPPPSTHFYQFCYLSAGQVRGASVPFYFVNQYAATRRGSLTDDHLRQNISGSDDSSCSRLTNNQCAPNSQNENCNIPPAVPCTSQEMNSERQPVPSDIRDMDEDDDEDDESDEESVATEMLQRKVFQLQRDKQILLSTVASLGEENATLKATVTNEVGRNQTMMQILRRSDLEIQRQRFHYDLHCRNNAVVVTELEIEMNQKIMKIQELEDKISEREMIIANYTRRVDGVNEDANANGGTPQFTPNAEHSEHRDGQFEQQGHDDVGAGSGKQRQNIRTSRRPRRFFAVLRKTRNYYATFLIDKAVVERNLTSLTNLKLEIMRKLCTMRERKEYILRLEYEYYIALECMCGVQSDESRRLFRAITESTAERRLLDQKAQFEVGTIDEIKNRLGINWKNICVIREKATEVYNKLIASYNCSMEHDNEAVQTELTHIKNMYHKLEQKFQHVLQTIRRKKTNDFIWK